MPMITPPLIWLSSVSVSMIRPQSWTATTFFTVTSPVSVSTSTSANCTPYAGPVARPGCCLGRYFVCTVSSVTPSFLQAANQLSPRASATPVCACNCCNASPQSNKTVGDTEAQVVLPPLPGPGG